MRIGARGVEHMKTREDFENALMRTPNYRKGLLDRKESGEYVLDVIEASWCGFAMCEGMYRGDTVGQPYAICVFVRHLDITGMYYHDSFLIHSASPIVNESTFTEALSLRRESIKQDVKFENDLVFTEVVSCTTLMNC